MAVHGSDENKPLACEECGKRFLSNSALACHLKVHDQLTFYDCPICNQPFEQIHSLKEHVHVHRINNVYTCPHCLKVRFKMSMPLLGSIQDSFVIIGIPGIRFDSQAHTSFSCGQTFPVRILCQGLHGE